eukprot:4366321-Pyramimonas_sp.AAC.1
MRNSRIPPSGDVHVAGRPPPTHLAFATHPRCLQSAAIISGFVHPLIDMAYLAQWTAESSMPKLAQDISAILTSMLSARSCDCVR